MVSVFSPPDETLLNISSGALYACRYLGEENLRVVPVQAIQSVVAMVPCLFEGWATQTSRKAAEGGEVEYQPGEMFFLAEKVGLEVLHGAGNDEADTP
jgi:hypothetical protein